MGETIDGLFEGVEREEIIHDINKSKGDKKITKLLLKILNKLRITPNTLSYTGVLFMFLFTLTIPNHRITSLLLLLGTLVLDGLDGSLARLQGVCSDKGKFTDMVCDSLTFTLFIIGLVKAGFMTGMSGLLYAYLMLLVKVLLVVKKNFHKPSDWLIHAKAGFFPNFLAAWSYLFFALFVITEALSLVSGFFLFNAGVIYFQKIMAWTPGMFSALLLFDVIILYFEINKTVLIRKGFLRNKFQKKSSGKKGKGRRKKIKKSK